MKPFEFDLILGTILYMGSMVVVGFSGKIFQPILMALVGVYFMDKGCDIKNRVIVNA